MKRLPRGRLWLTPALVAGAAVAAVSVALLHESTPSAPPPTPTPTPTTHPALAEATDPQAPAERRVAALKQLSRADDPAPLLAALDGLQPDDPQRAQVEAMALTALARFSTDARAQARLLRGLQPSAPRARRLLVLGVLARTTPPPTWAQLALEGLTHDRDAEVRTQAYRVLETLNPSSSPAPTPPR